MAYRSRHEVWELVMSKIDSAELKNVSRKLHRKAIRINGEKFEKRFSRKSDADKWYSEKIREKELIENGLSFVKSETSSLIAFPRA